MLTTVTKGMVLDLAIGSTMQRGRLKPSLRLMRSLDTDTTLQRVTRITDTLPQRITRIMLHIIMEATTGVNHAADLLSLDWAEADLKIA